VDIEWIKKCVRDNAYFFSGHADEERMDDNLTIFEIEEALLSGRILEDYPDDRRGESCLVPGGRLYEFRHTRSRHLRRKGRRFCNRDHIYTFAAAI